METYKLPDKEFKIIILMKLNELQKAQSEDKTNSGKSYMNKKNINEELQTMKKYQTELKS